MKRPVVKVVPTFGEKIVEILVLMIVVCMMIFPYIIYNRLPEIIPSHFNIRGEFDGYGNKDSFPVIILFIGLMFGMIYYFVKMSKC